MLEIARWGSGIMSERPRRCVSPFLNADVAPGNEISSLEAGPNTVSRRAYRGAVGGGTDRN